jgi:hypothetical protein
MKAIAVYLLVTLAVHGMRSSMLRKPEIVELVQLNSADEMSEASY